MKLGLLTAAFPHSALLEVADWASANGYEALEVACWPASDGAARRYAGVCHIDVAALDAAAAASVLTMLGDRGLSISALAYYPNNLDPDPSERERVNAHLLRVIDAAERLGVRTVTTFVGRDPARDVPANLAVFEQVWRPIVRQAGERGVRLAIENCPMIFSYDEWPGGTNLAYSPAIWRQMFEAIPDEGFGLNLDPSHLVWQMIDYERVVRDFSDRILHVHAKDMEIDREGLYRNGVMSAGIGWQVPRLPGLGEVQWDRFIAALYRAGYDDVISVEHEDRAFEGTDELVKRGFLLARDALRPLIV
jgi:sugar phosphate isomerase/epimerase